MTGAGPEQLAAALSGSYRLDRVLGKGGMATVYLAHDEKHDRLVAIKILRPDLAAAIGADRFLTEIRTTANLQHPHILPLFDSGSADGLLWYVMPYVEGETIRRRLDRGHDFSVQEAIQLVTDVADALDYAHKRGIVHRDIKPENILLHEGRPLVADFGIARAESDIDEVRLTAVGMAIGTPGYMSPEQSAGRRDLDGRSDQYSLACVLSEMITVRPRATGTTAEALPARGDAHTTAAVATTDSRSIAAIDAAIRRAMSRDPHARFATITAFAEALRSPPSTADEKSIAVLPFANMSADRDTDYFADGMAEEIINALTHIPGLRVVARTTAFSFKGRLDDLRDVGDRLQVRHVLEGSVRKAGSRLRITVQLVNTIDGYQLWSERYDREMDDVFAIQDEIATTIAAKLQVTLASADNGRLATRVRGNVQAYDEYLRGVALMHLRGVRILEAIDCFRRAIALDARYAPALAGLANALVLGSLWGITDPKHISASALDAASRALASGPDLAESHAAAALVAIAVEFDRGKAAREWDHAVALGPADTTIRAARAVFHLCYVCGNFVRAEADLRIALASDPLNQTVHAQLALVLAFARRPVEALDEANRAIAIDPDALFGQWVLILALLVQESFDEVLPTGNGIMRKFGRNAWIMMGMAQACAALGRIDDATALFDELVARSRTGYVQPGVLAIMAMDLGRRDDAVARWARAAADHDMFMVATLLHAPITDRLRAEHEHALVLRQIGWDTPLPATT